MNRGGGQRTAETREGIGDENVGVARWYGLASTLEAYRQLNEGVQARLGGHHSAQLLVWSANFARIVELQERGDWDEAARLLGTRFTMEQDFYRARLQEHGREPVVPPTDARELVHRIIYDEVVHGHVREESRRRFLEVVDGLALTARKASLPAVPRLNCGVRRRVDLPSYPTTSIHVHAATDWLLG